MTNYLATAGTRKVHFEFSWLAGKTACDSGTTVDSRLGEIPDGGQAETIATLHALRIAPSRLCGHCFPIRTRRDYVNHLRSL